MTDAEFAKWLASDTAIRIMLVEVVVNIGGAEQTLYVSNSAYVDNATGQAYESIIKGEPRFVERLSLTGEAGMSSGDIELYNAAGERDAWLGYVWANRSNRGWVGDPRWPRADFRPAFNGITADIDSSERGTLFIKLRDKLQRLNTPVSEAKLGGATPAKDELLPVALGECHNITPLLADPVTLEYQYHISAAERLIEVRDNAKPVAITSTLGSGKFKLTAQPVGAVTASVQGEKPGGAYANTIAALVQQLVTAYGKPSERFTAADIDVANFAAFEAAHPQPVGLYLKDRENVLSACQRLAGSIGAQMLPSRTGLLRLHQIAVPAPGTPTVINAANMVQASLHPVERLDVVAGVKIGFCRNWTAQPGLQTTVPAEHKDLYSTEWLTETVVDGAVQGMYRLHGDPEMRETCLLRRSDANAEAVRELALRKVSRTIYEFIGFPEMFALELGAPVTLFNPRYGMAGGVPGVVVSFDPSYRAGRVTVGVLV